MQRGPDTQLYTNLERTQANEIDVAREAIRKAIDASVELKKDLIDNCKSENPSGKKKVNRACEALCGQLIDLARNLGKPKLYELIKEIAVDMREKKPVISR